MPSLLPADLDTQRPPRAQTPALAPRQAPSIQYAGFTLRSAFQPIYSLSHQSLIGHEALLRTLDAGGRPVSPAAMFQQCQGADELRSLDDACRTLHAAAFARDCDAAQWLFLNVDASVFAPGQSLADPVRAMARTAASASLSPEQIVIELLEGALPDGPEFEGWVEALKRLGFLVALDDFGAGHSNFDRVFRLRPHIVKLDRSVIVRAAGDRTVRRVTTQMISLLHECGALVLIEGVETAREAAVALDSDADFVQGYFFGRPAPEMSSRATPSAVLAEVWDDCDARARAEMVAYKERVRPYEDALAEARNLLQAGRTPEEACATLLALDDCEVCYLLNGAGEQVGRNLYGAARLGGSASRQFAPLTGGGGARWSRRPYFRRAVAAPGVLQITRPYPTTQSHRMCMTLSVCFEVGESWFVLCGDMLWQSLTARPAFGVTTTDANL